MAAYSVHSARTTLLLNLNLASDLFPMRVALGIEYDGSRFSGWQRQSHRPSVQVALEEALSRVADHPVTVTCAGRTDAGVHATHQVIHFDTTAPRPSRAWVQGVNSNLPSDIRVTWVRAVPQVFHARFAATARSYRYVILSRAVPPALHHRRVAWTYRSLQLSAMRAAAQYLLGEHDFSSYRALACQARHPVRTVHRLDITRCGEYFYVDVTANAFLHHMVRNIAGVLLSIGSGARPPRWSWEILQARDRTAGGVTAPPGGLYLVAVRYPTQFAIPERGELPIFA